MLMYTQIRQCVVHFAKSACLMVSCAPVACLGFTSPMTAHHVVCCMYIVVLVLHMVAHITLTKHTVPCGVNDCATCGNTRDPATMCHACLPGYVLLLPTATNTSDRCVQGNTLGQPDPTQTNATIIAAVADTTPLAKFCAPHLRASCASCAPQTPSECSTCAVGFTKLGKRCGMFCAS